MFVLYASIHERVIGVGDTAPDFSITTDNGRSVSAANFGGKLLVLNFWATWCPPCIEEIPSLDQFAKEMANSGVVVLGVSVDKDEKVYQSLPFPRQRFLHDRARSGGEDQRRLRHLQSSRDVHHRRATAKSSRRSSAKRTGPTAGCSAT